MFRFLQFIVTIILLFGVLILFRKKMRGSGAFVTGLCVVLVISSVCLGMFLDAIPMPTETVRIEATQEKNQKSQGNIVGIKSVIVDGKKYSIKAPVEGNWYYSKDDKAYLWLNEGDERLTEPVTQEITIKIPVGAGRKLVFLAGSQFGIAKVSCGDESETYDLYKEGSTVKNITIAIADSNRFYDDFVKLCRLGGYCFANIAVLMLALWVVKNVEKERLIKLLYMGLSLVAALTFFLNLELTKRSGSGLYSLIRDFNRSFSGNYVLAIILVPMLYKTFFYCGEIYRKNFSSVRGTLCITLPAGLFAAFMIIGQAFINGDNTLRPIFDNKLQILKSLFGVTGYFAVFFFGITWIFNYLDCVNIYKVSDKKRFKPVQMYLNCLNERPFRTALITLIILYIPYMIASYPGIFMGDTRHHLLQIYGVWPLTNAHPIVPTLFMKVCVKAGLLLFGSSNIGLFIYSMSQCLFIISIVAFAVKLLHQCNVSSKITIFLILYYAIHPRIQYWMFLITKDIINAAFFLLFMVVLYMVFTGKTSTYTYVALGISDLGAMLFRHDSQYVIIISLILILITIKNSRKIIGITAVCTLSFALLWNSMLSWLNISPFHPDRDSLDMGFLGSIMLQQTARYVRDAGDEVTQEEYEIIDAVLDYEKIVSAYQPDDKSDGVAGIVRASTATSEDLHKYKKIWFKMFLKHPEIYIEATLNHKYQYLYPFGMSSYIYTYPTSESYMNIVNNNINEYMQESIEVFSYPNFINPDFRIKYFGLRESFFRSPIFNLLYTTSSYFWLFFVWLAYCILQKNKIAIAVTMPLLVTVLVLIAGPCNGSYFRYSYPYALCLPIVIVLGLHSIKQQDIEQGNIN